MCHDAISEFPGQGELLEVFNGCRCQGGILAVFVVDHHLMIIVPFYPENIVLAQQGLLTLDAGIPLILGSNLGTCVTAGLASIGASREAKRVALAHTMFKVGGILLFVLWIPTFADIIRSISPTSNAIGLDKLAAETPRQIANAHTLFNVSLAFIFLPFTILFVILLVAKIFYSFLRTSITIL